ncbi:F-box/kelch-repeat protein At3g23880-like isoform X1 [Spinacia oleracea]|uniref:F-box/kelch-repeat protein At3g23880-like n=1 Tax=Spinacia oleracea TaxID=3562 RepID=A0A9R0I199_SPIOL|nr:F-box/kelch-repeat protein At3g23880-like isoform X1 [Spinacia oleracea]XP_056699709.1 F-box/kelch-repeat protein At3g23880-like isoform X1 [Spinacia oleracea]
MRNRKKVMRKSESEYIPLHLCEEILARLPVKALLRFRCVCKSWRSIIDSSVFTYMHLKLYKNNNRHKNNLVVLGMERHDGKETICLRRINPFRRIGEQIELHHRAGLLHLIYGSCKGLLFTIQKNDETRLWNLSIRKSLLIHRCPISDYFNVKYVVGFAPSTSDYKVAAFTYNRKVSRLSIAVFSLRDHCWKVKKTMMIMSHHWHVQKQFRFHSVIFVEKATYWFEFSHGWNPSKLDRIMSFDFDVEEVNHLELPYVAGDGIIARFLCSIEDSLAVFSVSKERIRIWVLEKDRGSGNALWRVWFSKDINDGFCKFICASQFYLYSKILYLQDNATFLITLSTAQLISYNITSGEFRHLRKRFYGEVDTYVESLVSHTDPKWNASYIHVRPRKVRKNSTPSVLEYSTRFDRHRV